MPEEAHHIGGRRSWSGRDYEFVDAKTAAARALGLPVDCRDSPVARIGATTCDLSNHCCKAREGSVLAVCCSVWATRELLLAAQPMSASDQTGRRHWRPSRNCSGSCRNMNVDGAAEMT